jgi:hypothetical protein
MGQASAALSAAAGEDLASVGGPHSLAEAVLLGALTLLRLIGTEHLHTPPICLICCGTLAPLLDGGGIFLFPLPAVDLFWPAMGQANGIIQKFLRGVNNKICFWVKKEGGFSECGVFTFNFSLL